MTITPTIYEAELRASAAESAAQPRCADCAALWRPGWESVSGAMRLSHLESVGSLGAEATWDRLNEFHPHGTQLWSPDAPIALGWHPYNRCTLWRCPRCAGTFLRYTEYGGYYEEERIRAVQPELVCAPPYSEG